MYSTPPRTPQKSGIFEKRTFKPQYYEDYYGIRSPEEAIEGAAEKCESDSDSDDSLAEAVAKSQESQRQTGRYSRSARAWVTGSASYDDVIPIISSDESSSGGEEATNQGATVVIDLNEDLTPKNDGYQIVPSLNSKRSVPQTQAKKLKVRNFGLFSQYFGLSEDGMSDAVLTVDNGESAADEGETELHLDAPSSSREDRQGMTHRPADRIPIKQQLVERLAAKAKAEKAEKKARRLQEVADKRETAKKSKPASKAASKQKAAARIVGSKSSKPAGHTTELRRAVVVVDNRGIDFSAYKRYA